jgi:hypothetical protein
MLDVDFNKLIARAKNITLSPKSEWPVIAAEPDTVTGLYQNYIIILAALGPIAQFIGQAVFGISVPFFGSFHLPIGTLLMQLVLTYAMGLAMAFIVALIIDGLAPSFGGVKNQVQALKTVAYAWTPVWIVGILQLFPFLGVLTILVLLAALIYSIYLINLGSQHTMQIPSTRSAGFTAVVIIISIVIGFVLSMIIGLVSGVSGAMSGAMHSPTTIGALDGDDRRAAALGAIIAGAQQASTKMEAAKNSKDPNAQAAAAQQAVAAMMGGGDQVEALAPDTLKPFVPDTLSGLPRTSIEAARNAAIGIQVSNAKAVYQNPQGSPRIELEITDTGGAKGFLAMAGFAGMEEDKQTDSGYEKTYHDGNRLVHEEWNKSGNGEYTVILGDRFVVAAKGSGVADIGALKAAVSSVNLSGLEALRTQGVKRG